MDRFTVFLIGASATNLQHKALENSVFDILSLHKVLPYAGVTHFYCEFGIKTAIQKYYGEPQPPVLAY